MNCGPFTVPPLLVTLILPFPARLGTTTISVVLEACVMVAVLPLNNTTFSFRVDENPLPLIVTTVPTPPCVGLTDETTGGDTGSGVEERLQANNTGEIIIIQDAFKI